MARIRRPAPPPPPVVSEDAPEVFARRLTECAVCGTEPPGSRLPPGERIPTGATFALDEDGLSCSACFLAHEGR